MMSNNEAFVKEKILSEKNIESNNWIDLNHVEIILNNQYIEKYNVIKFKRDSVVTLVKKEDEILVNTQYRFIISKDQLELPGGEIEENEDAISASKREVYEESGIITKNEKYEGYFYTSNGITNQKIHIVFAEYKSGEIKNLDGEVSSSSFININKLEEALNSNEIQDGPSIIAFQKYLLGLGC